MLVSQFEWILYIFGAFLVYSGIKIYFENEDADLNPEDNIILKYARKHLKISDKGPDAAFFFVKEGVLYFTTLFLVIILIETTDLIFAVDSIPAAFAITQNEFLIYTSNIFAILGLRAKFFLLSGIIVIVSTYFKKGLSIVLIFIGGKMLLEIIDVHVPITASFSVIIGTLAMSIFLSILFPQKLDDEKLKPIVDEKPDDENDLTEPEEEEKISV